MAAEQPGDMAAEQPCVMAAELPPEMLERVFQSLGHQDLQAALQVCRGWRRAGEAPRLWTGVCLRASRERMAGLQEVLAMRRMLLVRGLRLEGGGPVSEDLLEEVLRHRGLSCLVLQGSHLSSVRPVVLAGLVSKLEELELAGTLLTGRQLQTLLQAVESGKKLRKLRVTLTALSSVEPGLLARAASQVEEVGRRNTRLTRQQIEAVLDASNGEARLARLDLAANLSLTDVAPGVLAAAAAQLEHVDISLTALLKPQVEAIFTSFGLAKKKRTLKIGYNNGTLNGAPAFETIIRGHYSVEEYTIRTSNVCEMVSQAEGGRSLPDKLLTNLMGSVLFGLYELSMEGNQVKMAVENSSYLQNVSPKFECALCEAIFWTMEGLHHHKLLVHLGEQELLRAKIQVVWYPVNEDRRPQACRNGDYCRFHSQQRCKFYHARPPQMQPY